MVWPFRRRKTGRHRLQSPQIGMVLPGVALASHAAVDVPTDAHDIVETVTPDVVEGELEVVEPASVSVPMPRVADEPEFMPLPARVVLFFEDGSQQVMTPLSDESERMRATAERLMGVPSDGAPRPVRAAHRTRP